VLQTQARVQCAVFARPASLLIIHGAIRHDRCRLRRDRCADPYLLSRLLHHLAPTRDGLYLDVGCGTGNYTIAMNDAGAHFAAIDASLTMLARAHQKRPSLALHQALAEALPFKSDTFSGATCTFVHHHMADPAAAFAEVRRVLRPVAKIVILNCTIEQMRHYWLWEYFPKACAQAIAPYERLQTDSALKMAGFKNIVTEPYTVREDLQDWFMMCGKYRPERYLDPRVLAGISCFAAAHDQHEITAGLGRLKHDIKSGRVTEIIRKYEWDGGDYMFTIALS